MHVLAEWNISQQEQTSASFLNHCNKCIFTHLFISATYAIRCSLHCVLCSSPRQEVTSSLIGASSGDERVTCASRTSTTPGLSARVSPCLRQLRQQSRGKKKKRERQVTSMRTHLDLTARSWPCSVNPPHTHTLKKSKKKETKMPS